MTPSPIFEAAIDRLARQVIELVDAKLKEQPAHPATPEHWASCQMLWCRNMNEQEKCNDRKR